VPIDKGADKEWQVRAGDPWRAKDGELVEAEQAGPRGAWACRGRASSSGWATRRRAEGGVADRDPPARHSRRFPRRGDRRGRRDEARRPQGARGPARPAAVTIDPADARDHDDAVYAHADDDPKNPGGHVIWVAIADVAHYVTPRLSALDREARKRGNSTYFPDRVVPMLPDRLSGDLCAPARRRAARLSRGADGDRRQDASCATASCAG
jgi:ribonuclease R